MFTKDRLFLAALAPVAQLDRVLVSETKGQRFESSRARIKLNQYYQIPLTVPAYQY